jgi:hypothetical protein
LMLTSGPVACQRDPRPYSHDCSPMLASAFFTR